MKEKRLLWARGAMFLAAFLVLLGAVRISAEQIRNNLEKKIHKTLQDVAEQNVIAVEQEIESKLQLLQGIARNLDLTEEDREDMLEHLQAFVDIYQFKRMGVIYADGTVCTTDGYVQDMSYRDYFQKGMQGKADVTDAMEEAISSEKELINVFSMPVYAQDKTTVDGVLFATYRTGRFQDLLNIESFDGNGYSFIVRSDGNMITNFEKSPMQDERNMFTALEEASEDNRSQVETLRQDMGRGGQGIAQYWYGRGKYLYYKPLNLASGSQWYIITTVLEDVLMERLRPVMRTVDGLLAVMVGVVTASILSYVYLGHKKKKELLRIAYEDPLTGGDNFACFQEKMDAKKRSPGFLVSLDLAGFKIINNTCGVEKGDKVICQVWDILQKALLPSELAAHVNADCFVMFLEGSKKDALKLRLDQLAETITSLSTTLKIPKLVPVMGVYQSDNMTEIETCYGCANEAKHLIKDRRDKNCAFYDELDLQFLQVVRMVEEDFDEAVREERFEIWYQPKYSVAEGTAVGAEALVRWRKRDGGLISPGVFIPVLEKNGMILKLDDYVFRHVCAQVRKWESEGQRMLPVSVNISRVSLYYSGIVEQYCQVMESFGLKPDYIQLEITESAVVDNLEIAGLIRQFKEAGFKLLLDDFGNGYSSLATLNTMRFDTMKLDKSLIDYIGDANGEKLLQSIILLAQSLGLSITAEGVERKEQLDFLKRLKCDEIQGFYFSKPLPLPDYEKILDAG